VADPSGYGPAGGTYGGGGAVGRIGTDCGVGCDGIGIIDE